MNKTKQKKVHNNEGGERARIKKICFFGENQYYRPTNKTLYYKETDPTLSSGHSSCLLLCAGSKNLNFVGVSPGCVSNIFRDLECELSQVMRATLRLRHSRLSEP